MVKFCPECGSQLEKEYKFCPECGYKLESENRKFESGNLGPHKSQNEKSENVLICYNCGEENKPNVEVCSGCGVKLNDNMASKKAKADYRSGNTSRKTQNPGKRKNKVNQIAGTQKKLNTLNIITLSALGLGIAAILLIFSGVLNPVIIPGANTTGTPGQTTGVNSSTMQQINSLETEIKNNPSDTSAILDLAHLKNDAGMYQQAIVNYKQYLALVPKDPDARIDMGVCYYNLQNYNEAIAQMELAVKYDPKHQIGYLNLGIVNLAAGNMKQSRKCLEKAVSLDPNSDYGKKAEELLKSHENTNQLNGGN